MKKKRFVLLLFMAFFAVFVVRHRAFAERKPVNMGMPKDSLWHEKLPEDEHGRAKSPLRHQESPFVEFDPESGVITIKMACDQQVFYCIKDGNENVVRSGNVSLFADVDKDVCFNTFFLYEECRLYMCVNGIWYCGNLIF